MESIEQALDASTGRVVVTAGVPKPLQLSDLDVYLEKVPSGDQEQPVVVVNHLASGEQLARVELEGTLGRNWDDVEARFNKKRRVLTISVQLSPPEGGAGAGPATAEAPAPPAAQAPPADSAGGTPNGLLAGGTPNGLLAGGAPGAPRDEDELSEQSFQSATEGQALGDEEGAASPLDSPSHPPVSPDGVCEAAGCGGGGKPGAGGESPAALPPGRATPNTPPHAHEPGPSPVAAAAALREDEETAAEQAQRAQQQAGAEAGEGGDEPGEPAAAGAKKKRRKSKKKKSKAGVAAAGGEAEAEEDADVEAAGEAAGTEGSAEAQEPDSPAEQQQQQQQEAAGGEGEAEGPASEGEGSQPEAAAAAAAEQQAQESCAAAGSAGQGVWSSEPAGEWGPLAGPAVRGELAKQKSSGKGEDQWLVKPQNGWSLEGLPGEASFAVFGIFDGHGGRSVATYASNNLLKLVMARVNAAEGAVQGVPALEGLSEEERARWRLQATLLKRLPQACRKGFLECDAAARRSFKRGGSTATLAFVCGWELLVANCGDSCAYLDTGGEVQLVCGNHRLDDNPAEQERIKAEGGEIARSTVDGKPVGPLRVWPGGLAMSRSIGDAEAEDRVRGEPEICQVTIPPGGARLIIGSDGLWDAIHPKSAANTTRDMVTTEAAHRLLAQAIKADNLKDDVTIIVVDLLPDPACRLPPSLPLSRASSTSGALSRPGSSSLSRAGSGIAALARTPSAPGVRVAHVWHPLAAQPGTPRSAALCDFVARGAERRQEVLAEQRVAEEERLAEELAVRERQQDQFRQMLRKAQSAGLAASELRAALVEGGGAAAAAEEDDDHEEEEEAEEGQQAQQAQRSQLYQELLNLRLTPEDMAAAFAANEEDRRREESEQQQAAAPQAAEDEWETVGKQKAQQPAERRQPAPRGRGRGGRGGGRGRGAPGRGRGSEEWQQQGQQGEENHHPEFGTAAGQERYTHYPSYPPRVDQLQAAAPVAADGLQAGGGEPAPRQRLPPREGGRGRGQRYPRDRSQRREREQQHRGPPGQQQTQQAEGGGAAGEGGQQAQQEGEQHGQQHPRYERRYERQERRPRREGPHLAGQDGAPGEGGQQAQQQEGGQQYRQYQRRPRFEGPPPGQQREQQQHQQGAPGEGGEGERLPPREFQRRRREERGPRPGPAGPAPAGAPGAETPPAGPFGEVGGRGDHAGGPRGAAPPRGSGYAGRGPPRGGYGGRGGRGGPVSGGFDGSQAERQPQPAHRGPAEGAPAGSGRGGYGPRGGGRGGRGPYGGPGGRGGRGRGPAEGQGMAVRVAAD